MDLESYIADRNADYFLREFTYTASRFRSADGQERELCDGAIWIGELLILMQLKERDLAHDSGDAEEESRWFSKKVSKRAVDQLNSSIRHLNTELQLPLANMRSQLVDVANAKPRVIHHVVIYRSSKALPNSDLYLKGRASERIGFVHFLHAYDWVNVCATLHTPAEISDYLSYRAAAAGENLVANQLPEKALLGNYLSDTGIETLQHADELFVDTLVDNRSQFDISGLLRVYLDRIVSGNDGLQYHLILTELAKLTRAGLKEFRTRLFWAMEKCQSSDRPIPSRFHFPGTDCSFVFVPLSESERSLAVKAAVNYTMLSKYDFRSTRALGLSVTPDPSPGAFQIQWCLLDGEWSYDATTEKFLAGGEIFRETKPTMLGKYNFDGA